MAVVGGCVVGAGSSLPGPPSGGVRESHSPGTNQLQLGGCI